MTEDICVMNRSGIALAADSAVSLSGNSKVYNSANKLFSLTKEIGIMIYGSASYLGIPWETIIKVFKSNIQNENFLKLNEVSDLFFSFLNNQDFHSIDAEFFDTLTQMNSLLTEILEEELSGIMLDQDLSGLTSESDRLNEIFDDLLFSLAGELSKNVTIITDSNLFNTFKESYHSEIDKLFKEKLFFKYTNKTIYYFTRCAYLYLIKDVPLNNLYTGVVFAGFGQSEIFPQIEDFKVFSSFIGYQKVIKNPEIKIGNDMSCSAAAIRPFAQQEMVYTFMNGIDKKIHDELPLQIYLNASENFDQLVLPYLDPNLSSTQLNEIKSSYLDSIMKNTSDYLFEISYYEYQMPILSILDNLPKEELAIIAETLVNLTSFKRKISLEIENVGGPIDVALITKGDGFVWIKRKHYFKAELNPHLIKTYI